MGHPVNPTCHPPKPRLTVRVGVAGHRPDKLVAASSGAIEQQLKKVFAATDAAANELLAVGDGCYASDPPIVRLVSGFAEGSDRLALSACPANWQIEAILPFPRARYINTLIENGAGAEHTKSLLHAALKKAQTVTELSLRLSARCWRRIYILNFYVVTPPPASLVVHSSSAMRWFFPPR